MILANLTDCARLRGFVYSIFAPPLESDSLIILSVEM